MMKQIDFKIDEIFDLLGDLKWHTVDEISREISLSKPKIRTVLKLMADLGHIEYGQEKARIIRKTLEWLRATERDLFTVQSFDSASATRRLARWSRRQGASSSLS